jgi:hypothetical protein
MANKKIEIYGASQARRVLEVKKVYMLTLPIKVILSGMIQLESILLISGVCQHLQRGVAVFCFARNEAHLYGYVFQQTMINIITQVNDGLPDHWFYSINK